MVSKTDSNTNSMTLQLSSPRRLEPPSAGQRAIAGDTVNDLETNSDAPKLGGWNSRQADVSQEIAVLRFAVRAQKTSPRQRAH